MKFTVIDGKDFSDLTHEKRNVVVTLSIGDSSKPDWEDVVSYGSHSLNKE